MRNIQKLRAAVPERTRWLLCTLAALTGVFAAMAGFGLSTAAQAAAKSGSKHTASTTKGVVHTAAHTVAATKAEVMPYSGGRQMTADPSGGYWTVSWVGAVTAYGGAPTFGSPVLSGI